MKSGHTVLEVLFPQVRASILRALFGQRGQQFHVRQLARSCGLALSTVQQELHRLTVINVVASSRHGKFKIYRATHAHALAEHLARIVQVSQRASKVSGSSLRLPKGGRKRKKRSPTRPRTMRPDRQPNWGIFQKN